MSHMFHTFADLFVLLRFMLRYSASLRAGVSEEETVQGFVTMLSRSIDKLRSKFVVGDCARGGEERGTRSSWSSWSDSGLAGQRDRDAHRVETRL